MRLLRGGWSAGVYVAMQQRAFISTEARQVTMATDFDA